MSTQYSITLSQRQQDWTDEWNTSINPIQATSYFHLATPQGLLLQMCSNVAYGGWLAKNVVPLPAQTATVTFQYQITIDPATPISAQVIETDMKLTDAAGYTYDGSFQFNIAAGWKVQVSGPWQDTGVSILPFAVGATYTVTIAYALDYVAHTITFVSLTVASATVSNNYVINKTFAAAQVGWGKNQIVTQLQQCANAHPSGYTLLFPNLGYTLQ